MSRWIYGKHTVLERLALGKEHGLEALVLSKTLKANDAKEIEAKAKPLGIRVQLQNKSWLDERCKSDRHQGVAAMAKDFKYVDLAEIIKSASPEAIVLVLDGLEDPHNLGAILRSAECAGVAGVVIPKDRATGVTPTVEKVAAGAASMLKITQVTNLSRALEELKKANFWSYGLAGKGKESLFSQDFRGRVALVMGAEDEGLRENVANHCDKLVKIPLKGKVESLNVSVATGVALFEVLRRKGVL